MSDFDSSQPVRTQTNGDIVGRLVDGTVTTQFLGIDAAGKIGIKISDGSGTALTSTLIVAKQALDVNVANAISVGVADKTAFTYGTTTFLNVGGVFQDTSPSLTAGQSGALRLTANRAIHANLRDASGNALLGSAVSASSIPVVIASDQSTLSVKDGSDGPVTPGTVATFSSLIGGQFNAALPTLTTGQQSAIQLDASGRLIIAPLSSSSIVTVSNLPITVDTNYGTVGASTIRVASQIGNATGAANFGAGATGAQTLRVEGNQGAPNTAANGWPVKPTDGTNSQSYTAAGSAKVDLEQIVGAAPSATNPLPSRLTDGTSFIGPTNPLPVYLQDAGTSVNDYNTATAIAANATSNHDYTVTAAKTLHLGQIHGSASGKLKIEVQIETGVASGVFTSKFVGFSSSSTPNIDLSLVDYIEVAAGVRVRIIRTNRDIAPLDVFSTISGREQ